ncbi:hypothetical protein TNCV_3192681 [Trichonephila clavipes]|nr:hypothetical protein TNCV_3192681 [Trichonephila clavipes]
MATGSYMTPIYSRSQIDDEKVCTASIMADKNMLECVQSSKYINGADSDDENEINNENPDPPSSLRKYAQLFRQR